MTSLSAKRPLDNLRNEANETVDRVRRDAAEVQDNVVNQASELAGKVNDKLKSVGVDTDVMASAARDQMTELQRILSDEMRARPYRALGVAAAVGLIVGLMSAR